MKKLLVGIAALGMVSQVAYASQARLIALGLDELDNEGSFYIQDSRNIFLNSANVNNYADMVTVEFGSNGRGTSGLSNNFLDQDNLTKAQGGFFKRVGNMVYGAYLGNESNTSAFLRVASTGNATSLNTAGAATSAPAMNVSADNQIDLFVGSTLSSGIKWGANLVYLNNENETRNEEDKAGSVRLGLIADKWDALLNVSFMNEGKNTVSTNSGVGFGSANAANSAVTQEFEGKLGIQVGGGYQLGMGRLYATFKTFQWDQKDNYDYTGWTNVTVGTRTVAAGKTGTSEGKFDTYNIGYGVVESVNDSGKLFTNVHLKLVDIELKMAQTVSVKNTTVPLTIGYEHQANSWLALRGSITHNLYGQKNNKNFSSSNLVVQTLVSDVYGSEGKGSIPNQTRVNAGATLTFGKLTVDGVIGTTTSSRTGGADTASKTQSGVLALDNLMTRVAATYMF